MWQDLVSLIVLDSVAALMPERIVASDYDPNTKGMGELAREMAQHLSKIASAAAQKECTVIFINQLRKKIGEKYGPTFDTPGGWALKFYASQRVLVNKINSKSGQVIQTNEDGIEEVVGHYARVTVTKNKRNEPFFDALEIPIYYREYFPDVAKTCYDLSRKLQVITTRRGALTWKDEKGDIVAQTEGESNMLQFIRGTEGEEGHEKHLAHCCVMATNTDKNRKRKIPVKCPTGIVKLAKQFIAAPAPAKGKSKKTPAKSVKSDADELDLD